MFLFSSKETIDANIQNTIDVLSNMIDFYNEN